MFFDPDDTLKERITSWLDGAGLKIYCEAKPEYQFNEQAVDFLRFLEEEVDGGMSTKVRKIVKSKKNSLQTQSVRRET